MSNKKQWPHGSKQCTSFDCLLVQFVVETNSALNIVDKECFQRILHPQYNLPGSTYFTETVLNDVYKDTLQVIQQILENVQYIGVQIDHYTASNHYPYANVCVTFIGKDVKFHGVSIGTLDTQMDTLTR